MLYTLVKYNAVSKTNSALNTENKISNKSKKQIRKNYLYRNTRIVYYSIFLRRLYFRSLLLYVNIMYSNLVQVSDKNTFYFVEFIIAYYSQLHPGFFTKKLIIR
jgi:hypothetical protein